MAKTVCKTNIHKALRRSWDTHDYEDVNDEWMASVYVHPFTGAVQAMLWNWSDGTTWRTPTIWALSMTEALRMATMHLLDCYERPEDAVMGRAGLLRREVA